MWGPQGHTAQPQVRVTAVMADSQEESWGGFDTSAQQWVLLLGSTALTIPYFSPYSSDLNPDVSEH